ncbi:MAG: hypothetical protein KJ710_01710 [Candidatus Omnitrophica bacterium]|nr:hypothetical protein [Candidatus Omnitrophota bacterium]MBU1922967.1 hypothetical protein [Candidatus Omnitrophota bacterium]
MGKVRIGICCAVFCLFSLSLCFSETILLKSGQKVEGRIVEKTDTYVKLDFLGVDLVYYKDEIASIVQGASNSENTVSPQLESLYQAYASSLNVPQKPKEGRDEEVPAAIIQQATGVGQSTPAMASTGGLSQLTPETQNIIQKTLQGAQGGQAGGSKLGGMPLGVDLSQLPPEYQEMVKSTMINLQAAKSEFPEEKE